MDIYLKIVRHLKPALAAELLGFVVFSAFLEVVSVWLLRSLFLVCLGQSSPIAALLKRLPVVLAHDAAITVLLLMLLGTFLFILVKNVIFAFVWRAVLRRLANEQAHAAWRLFEHYLRVPFAAHTKRSWSILQRNLSAVSSQLFLRLVFPTLQTFSECLVLAGIFLFLMIKAPTITVLLAVWLGGAMVAFRMRAVRASRAAGKGRDRSVERMLRLSREFMGDFKSIKLWAREDYFAGLYRNEASTLARHLADDRFMTQLPRFVFEPVLIGGLLVLYLILIGSHASQARTLGDLTLYAAAAVRILPAAQRVIGQMHLLAFDHANLAAIIADFEQPAENLPERPEHDDAAPFEQSITFDHVSFRHPGAAPVLQDVSVTINRGEKVAIVGKTGAGKTSFLNILLGFTQPTSGRVLLDGGEVAPLTRFRQTRVAYVQQDVFLLDASVAENIAFASTIEDIDAARLWDALCLAHLDLTVRSFPDGLDTKIGENGIALSGGERQRLALARAFYQNPALLVLDEATSQIDVTTEMNILTDLLERQPGITLVMVTHRPTVAERFASYLRIENGAVREVVSARKSDGKASPVMG